MENTAGIVRFNKPVDFDTVIVYADSTKNNFETVRNLRPSNMEAVKKSIWQILVNCRFKNCIANQGYIKALGLKTSEEMQH
jgi:hypothetical protein